MRVGWMDGGAEGGRREAGMRERERDGVKGYRGWKGEKERKGDGGRARNRERGMGWMYGWRDGKGVGGWMKGGKERGMDDR